MNRPEQQIQHAVISHLKARAESGVFYWSTPNEGRRGYVAAAALKASGLTAGIPDLLILKDGQLYGLELKAPKGRPTPAQNRVLDRLTDCGAYVSIAHSVDEALVTLEFWGIIKREASHERSTSRA